MGRDDSSWDPPGVKAAGYIGLSAANLVNILSPELLLLGGTMVEQGSQVVERVTRNFRSLVMPSLREVAEVRRSELGARSCVMGAAAMVFDALLETYPDPPHVTYDIR